MNGMGGATGPSPGYGGVGAQSDTSKLLAVLGYVFWIVALVALLIEPYRHERFVRLHATQAIVVGIVWTIGWMIPIIGWIAAVVAFVFGVIGFINALQGRDYHMPIVYGLVRDWVEPPAPV